MAIDPLNARIAELQRNAENKARLAHAYARFKTVGNGTFEFDQRIDFGLTFVERPFIACGWQIEEQGDDEGEGYPLATAYVTDWDTTDRDHYVGCWVAVTVGWPYTGATVTEFPEYKLWHDFTFSGIALKDIPLD
jgi:hypothetical protein